MNMNQKFSMIQRKICASMYRYIFAYMFVIVLCIVLTPYVHLWMHGVHRDAFTENQATVLNALANQIIAKKNTLYNMSSFYTSGSPDIDLTPFNLVYHSLSLADIECITSEKEIDSCASYSINDVSIPRPLTTLSHLQSFTCGNRELGNVDSRTNIFKVRILNYEYTFQRSCLQATFTRSERQTTDDGVYIQLRNNKSAQLFVLLRPMFVTTNMGYLYEVLYDENPIYYNYNQNSVRIYNSQSDLGVNIRLRKVTNKDMYITGGLIDIYNAFAYDAENASEDCNSLQILNTSPGVSQEDRTPSDATPFNMGLTLYYVKLAGKRDTVQFDITNSMTLFFDVDFDKSAFASGSTVFNIVRSAIHNSNVCRSFDVRSVTTGQRASTRNFIIQLNATSSMSYVFEFPQSINKFKVFITYTVDAINVLASYVESNQPQFKFQSFKTFVISSWSTSDITDAIRTYGGGMPSQFSPLTNFSVPTYLEIVESMKAI